MGLAVHLDGLQADPVPELPEVETTRRYLAPVVEGALIEAADIRRERTARRNLRPGDVVDRLTGRQVIRLGRRGKFLMADLTGDLTWVIHLGMSGRLRITVPGDPEDPHTNFLARTDRGDEIRLVDPRTFGFVAVFTHDELAGSSLAHLGPDALDNLPTAIKLGARLAGRTAPIKAILLDQRIVAGLGNIYADEVLYRARIHPQRQAGGLGGDEVRLLRRAIPVVLTAGLRHGGTSLEDNAFRLPDGRSGQYLGRLAVYGRAGEQCRRCGHPIERRVVAQRSSYFCPQCQPMRP